MKISKKAINSYWIVAILVMMERTFYLFNNSDRILIISYAVMWYILFISYMAYQIIIHKSITKNSYMYFKSDILGLSLMVFVAAFQCNLLTGQPIGQGLMPQRNYVTALLSYFVIRKMYDREYLKPEKVEKGLIVVGIISVFIYCLQIILFNKVSFITAARSSSGTRLYVDSVLCVFIGFWGADRYLRYSKKKYLILVVLTFIYEFFVSKGRLETAALMLSIVFGVMLLRKNSARKFAIYAVIVSLILLFINTEWSNRFFEAINYIDSGDLSKNTMGIRIAARASFGKQLAASIQTMIFGCGYPNVDNDVASAMIGYQQHYGLVDNGIFAFAYVYGGLGICIFVKWFYKLIRCAWECYKKLGIYLYLMIVVFNILLLYNITFWWHKASWTLLMVVLMCDMEHKLFDGGISTCK